MTLQTRVPENFHSCRWGDERTVKRAQTVSEDPHRRERIFISNQAILASMLGLGLQIKLQICGFYGGLQISLMSIGGGVTHPPN